MKTKEFPLKPLVKISKDAGVGRMSADAAKSLRNVVLNEAEEIATKIVSVTKHADRKTVMESDVLFVTSRELPKNP